MGLTVARAIRFALVPLAAVVLSAASLPASAASQPHGVPELSEADWDRVDELLESMTVRQKAGQMLQIALGAICSEPATATTPAVIDPDLAREVIVEYGAGSILNTAWISMTPEAWVEIVTEVQRIATEETPHGIPLIYGIDSVHGANYISGATIFPQNLNLGATWNPELARLSGEVAAAESRAVGLTWNFAPVCDLSRNPVWSRVFETFGEDPVLASRMAAAAVEGMQGDDLASPRSVAATAKHFLGYSDPRSGRDRSPAIISTSDLLETHAPPFEAAFDAGVRTIMINSGEINGTPVHADPTILTELLRDEMGFGGVAVTDWRDIEKLVDFHFVAEDEREATYLAINAGIDVAMTPLTTDFVDHVVALVEEGRLTEDRIDESVRRILALKVELGLFEEAVPAAAERTEIGAAESQRLSLEAARQSITLLRNRGGMLPLDSGTRILVTGPASDDLVSVHGSWTYSWQGTDAELYPDTPTIADALRERFGNGNVVHVPGASFTDVVDLSAARDAAAEADVVVLCLGEQASTEEPGDINDLTISQPQIDLARSVAATGTPVVLVMVTNRPRIITPIEADMHGIIWAGHPGPWGPRALAEILAGEINPSGRLPFTYPKFPHAIVTYDHKHTQKLTKDDPPGTGYVPLFPFGTGLGYTTFGYEALEVDAPAVDESGPTGPVRVDVRVTNTGDRKEPMSCRSMSATTWRA
jgi:beta-glucosidase